MTPKRAEATCLMALFFESPFGMRLEAGRVLPALAGVGLAADAVHGDGQRLVRLLGDGAVAHGAGLEPVQDRLHRLDLGERHRPGAGLEVHEAAQRAEGPRLVVHQRGVLLVGLVAPGPAGVLEPVDRLRVEEVVLAVGAVLVLAAGAERGVADGARRVGAVVALLHLAGHHVDAHAADAARRSR